MHKYLAQSIKSWDSCRGGLQFQSHLLCVFNKNEFFSEFEYSCDIWSNTNNI